MKHNAYDCSFPLSIHSGMVMCHIFVALICFVSCWAPTRAAHFKRSFCNSFDPQCDIAPERAFQTLLTPNNQLLPKLLEFKRRARFQLQVGPLIYNDGNDGIINIDKTLSPTFPAVNTSICGADSNPTIREAVICTVTNDEVRPLRGNVNASRIGYSTQGRPLIAVRFGNPRGIPIFIVTQQHGNEPASTEAVFKFLRVLQTNPRLRRQLLRVLHILILIRANPDAGEPTGTFNLPVAPFNGTEAFFRHNVDRAAGGGFVADSEPGFFGVVGRGYDLNRYHYIKLDGPIKPVETQAMVATHLAFRPQVIIDMHGDIQKSVCEVDRASIEPGSVLGILPSGNCAVDSNIVPSLTSQRNESIVGSFFVAARTITIGASDEDKELILGRPLTIVETISRKALSGVISKLQSEVNGILARFSQLALGASSYEGPPLGSTGGPETVATGWEVVNFVSAFRPAAVSVKIVNGSPVPRIAPEPYIPEPCFLRDNICLHELFLRTSLLAIANIGKSSTDPFSGVEFCDIPVASGFIASAPSSLGWANLSVENEQLIPYGIYPAAPAIITASCPIDFELEV